MLVTFPEGHDGKRKFYKQQNLECQWLHAECIILPAVHLIIVYFTIGLQLKKNPTISYLILNSTTVGASI